MLGIASSNYAGNAGMSLNPTSMLLMPSSWEIGLVTVNVQAENNYIGFPKRHLTRSNEVNNTLLHGGLVDYYTPGKKQASAHVMVKAPSFILKVQDWGFAFSTSLRTDLSVRHIDPVLAKVLYDGLAYVPIQGKSANLSGATLAGLSWIETSLSVGKQLTKSDSKKWLIGISGKYLTGIQGISVKLNSGRLSVINDTMLTLTNVKGTAGYGVFTKPQDLLHMRIGGFGTDIGVAYVSNPFVQQFSNGRLVPSKRYDYRLGFSLIDIGFIRFTNTAKSYSFNSNGLNADNIASFSNGFDGIDSMLAASSGSAPKNKFMMALPAAASVQFDRCIHPRWYVNLTVIQRLPLPIAHVQRANSISASIRYETPYFEVSMPYSFHDYYRHRLGLALRYHFLFAGTDKLGTFYGNNDITGVDVYFGIKIKSIEFMHRKRGGKAVRCPAYS